MMSKESSNIMYYALLLIISYCFCCCHAVENVVIDTDAGVDDAVAILLLLRAELDVKRPSPFKVIAITCSYGNVAEKNVETNVLKTLTIANRSDIPVYAGAKRPLIGNFTTDNVFGKDGFGDAKFYGEIRGSIDRSKHASVALIELSKQYKNNLSIVVLCPTTNTALAMSLDNDFVNRVNRFYVMGSSVSGYGLYKPNVEFNFAADPESNYILLNSSLSSNHLTLFPWEAAYFSGYSVNWRKNVFGKYNSRYVNFLNAIEAHFIDTSKSVPVPADALSVAAMLRPSMVRISLDTNVEAVTDGAARGSVLMDYRPASFHTKPNNARIIQAIDIKEYERTMVDLLTCESIPCY